MRHSYASLMLESGSDFKTIGYALGYSTIKVTADTYVYLTPSMKHAAADRLDELIG